MLDFLINTAQAVSLPTFGQESLPAFISSVYSFALTIVGIAVFVRILQAGFLLLTSAGNASKAGNAKTMMQNAVIGAILLFASYMILYVINPDLVKNTLNFRLPRGQQVSTQPLLQTSPTNTSATLAGFVDGRGPTSAIPVAHAQAGIYVFTIRVVDANGDAYDQEYTMEVTESYALESVNSKKKPILSGRAHYNSKVARAEEIGGLTISTKSVPDAVVGWPYFAEIFAAGGRAPYAYSVVDGGSTLPNGISLQSTVDMPILTIQNRTAQRTPSYAFNQTDRFLLEVTNAAPNSNLYFKWIKDGNPWYYPGKSPDRFDWTLFGNTDAQGRWTNEANFTPDQVGTWVETVLVAGAISRPINFQVLAPQVAVVTSQEVQSTSSSVFSFTACTPVTYCEDTATGEQTAKLTDEEINQLQKTGQDLSGDRCPDGREVTECHYPYEEASRAACDSYQFEWRNCIEDADEMGFVQVETPVGGFDFSGLPEGEDSEPGKVWTADGTPLVLFDADGKPIEETLEIQKIMFCRYTDQIRAKECGMPWTTALYCEADPFTDPNTGETVYCIEPLP